MPKKATSNQAEEKQVSEAAFLKAFDKKKAAAKAAAKTERPAGFLDDQAILAKLGLAPNDRQTYQGAVSKIVFSFAKNDTNRPMFRFAYVLVSDDKKANGLIVSTNHIIEEAKNRDGEVWRTEEEAFENLFQEFQGLGEDTAAWNDPIKDAVNAAKHHTAAKTPISITLSHYVAKSGKQGLGIKVNGPLSDNDNSDLESSDDTSSEESGDEFNAEDWLGGWVEFNNDEYGAVRMKVTSYDADSHTFSGTDADGGEWTDDYAPDADSVEWSNNQDD